MVKYFDKVFLFLIHLFMQQQWGAIAMFNILLLFNCSENCARMQECVMCVRA